MAILFSGIREKCFLVVAGVHLAFIVLCVGTSLCQTTHPLAVWLLPESTTETVHSARLYGGSARGMTEASLK